MGLSPKAKQKVSFSMPKDHLVRAVSNTQHGLADL